jgi:glycosyltransferase involved in cell wall biosynthesis
MKIVILQDRLRLGGTETQALALGGLWAKAGHDVRLVAFRPGGELAETPAAKALQLVVLQRRDWRLDWFAPKLRETVAGLAPDVIVAFGREANAKLPKLAGLAPRVGTVRSGRKQPGRFWRGLRAAEAVVANTRWAVGTALAHGVSKKRIQVIYSGLARDVRVADPAAARAEWRKRAETPAETVVLLCVACFREGKGQDILLRAVAQLDKELRWQLWLAGDGPWLRMCRDLAVDLKLQKRVRFLGTVEDPAPLYAAADVAALASEAESLPNFVIEAQAAGLPVVTTNVGGMDECVDDGRTGRLAPEYDMLAFAEALGKTIRDPAWRAAAREPAQAQAAKLFDASANTARWLGLLGDVVAGKGEMLKG